MVVVSKQLSEAQSESRTPMQGTLDALKPLANILVKSLRTINCEILTIPSATRVRLLVARARSHAQLTKESALIVTKKDISEVLQPAKNPESLVKTLVV